MIRSTWALLTRSCRVDSRSLPSHLFRLIFAGAVFFTFLIERWQSRLIGAPGLTVFKWICWINAVGITFGAISYFATAITEEKDDLTLGLLRMTGMNPLALLLGKSTSRLIAAGLALCVQFPFVLLAITLGGILWDQIVFAYLALLAYLIGVANLALFCSVRCRTSNGASKLMSLILGAFFAGVPLAQWKLNDLTRTGDLSPTSWIAILSNASLDWLEELNIFTQINACVATGFVAPVFGNVPIWTNIAAGFIFFALAWGRFEHYTLREQAPQSPLPFLKTLMGRARKQSQRAWKNAILWKDFHFMTGGIRIAVAKVLLYGLLWMGLMWYIPRDYLESVLATMVLAVGVESAIYASRVFSQEVREKTLPLLKMLPAPWILSCWSKIGGCLLGLVPVLCYLGWAMWLNADAHRYDPQAQGFFSTTQSWLIPLAILLFLHLTMYLSLVIKHGAIPVALLAVYFSLLVGEMVLVHWYEVDDRYRGMEFLASTLIVIALQVWIAREFPRLTMKSFMIHVGIFVCVSAILYFWFDFAVGAYVSWGRMRPFERTFLSMDLMTIPLMIGLQLLIARRIRSLSAS